MVHRFRGERFYCGKEIAQVICIQNHYKMKEIDNAKVDSFGLTLNDCLFCSAVMDCESFCLRQASRVLNCVYIFIKKSFPTGIAFVFNSIYTKIHIIEFIQLIVCKNHKMYKRTYFFDI